jgi:hypothetical protein
MKISCEVFLAINEDGGYVVVKDESEALEKLAEDEGGYHARVVKLTIKITPPQMTEAEVEVPDEAGESKIEADAA